MIVALRQRARGAAGAYGPAFLLLVALIALWEGWVRAAGTRPYILPAPSRIWDAFLQTRETLPGHIQTTLTEAVLGLLAGATAGVILAAALAVSPLIRRLLYPVLVLSQNIPMVVLAPLLIVWLGFGMEPKIVVVALITVFPVCLSTTDGLLGADRDMVDLVRSMGGRRWAVLRYVRIPGAIPSFFGGLKIASAYAILGAVIGEWVGASSGLGIFITRAQASFRVDRVFVAVVIVAALSIALFAIVSALARLASPWRYVREDDNP
ncbi:MAG: ABC transporter permease [Dehalococcoidia bacterium]